MRRVSHAAWVLWMVVLVAAVACGGGRQDDAANLPDFGAAPSFTLTDQQEREVRSEDLSGQVVLASFVYTNCQDICPMVTARMRSMQERLQSADLLDGQVTLLSFTTDPNRDTPAALRDYASRFEVDERTWRFLTGSEQAIRSVIVDGFRLEAEALPPSGGGHEGHSMGQGDNYEVMHSGRIVLVDANGRIRAYYDSASLDYERVLREIRALVPQS